MSRPFTALVVALALWSVGSFTHAGQAGQRVERDVAYGAGPLQRLDLSVPAGTGFPTVIFVHGGSLTSGDKSDNDYGRVCESFPAEGIACANVNYRLMPDATWPAQPEDVAAAIAWVHHNIAARGGHPEHLFLLGHSSGAMLVGLVAAQVDYLAQHKLTSRVLRGVMPMGSIMWDVDLERAIDRNGHARVEAAFGRDPRGQMFGSLDRYQSQWPINGVRAGLPPYLFLIAESEQTNPPILSTNQAFVDQSRALGNQAALTVFAGRTHYSAIRQVHQPGDDVFAAILAFVRHQR